MASGPSNVLFLCTGNSARSLMAEAYLNAVGKGRWKAFSAGSKPEDRVHPLVHLVLAEVDLDPTTLRPKSWDEFTAVDAPRMHAVITLCEISADELCPLWPGSPRTLHWPIPDPAAIEGSIEDRMATFRGVLELIRKAVDGFMADDAKRTAG
jgi:arsenate reductase (thioredoxin)